MNSDETHKNSYARARAPKVAVVVAQRGYLYFRNGIKVNKTSTRFPFYCITKQI